MVTRTSISFSLIPLALTIEQVTVRGKKSVAEAPPVEPALVVRLPYWFLQQQYALQLRRATAGWLFSRHVHRIVPDDCSLFEACESGDIDSIKTLLSTREASISDRTTSGATAFEFAMQGGQLEVCRLLRQAGIFSQFQIADYFRTFASLQRSISDFSDHNRSLLRTVIGHDDPDEHWFAEHCSEMREREGRWIQTYYASSNLFTLLLRADHTTALLQISDLKAYFEARTEFPFPGRHFLPFPYRILSNTAVVHQLRLNSYEYKWLMYELAREIAQGWHNGEDANQWSSDVQNVMATVADAGLVPHHTSGSLYDYHLSDDWLKLSTMTPLGLLCVEAVGTWPTSMRQSTKRVRAHANATLKAWVTGLSRGAVDLMQYATEESSVFGCSPDLLRIPWGTDGEILISTGRDPRDWSFSLWEPCESYARVFWHLVEGTPVVPDLVERILSLHSLTANKDHLWYDLPGSWPEERMRRVQRLEEWLLWEKDDVLSSICEDLTALSGNEFFSRWERIGAVLDTDR